MESLSERQRRAIMAWRERWAGFLDRRGRRMGEMELISTDIGYISADNLNYLFEQKLLNEDGCATRTVDAGVLTWCKLCEVYGYIKNKLKETENPKAKVTSDDVVTCMRLGKVKVLYAENGMEYVETYRNPLEGSFNRQYEKIREEADERLRKLSGKRKSRSSYNLENF